MEKEYPYLSLPEDTECIFERVRGFFHGRADSDVYLSADKKNLYKSYDYSPYEISLYHALHSWSSQNIQLLWNIVDPLSIDKQKVSKIDIYILPLYQDQIFQSDTWTITTPTYIPWPTLTDIIENSRDTWSHGYEYFIRQVCIFIWSKIWENLWLYHPNFYPHISPDNIKYKIQNDTLCLLVTDIGWPEFGVYNLIREMKQHYGNQVLESIVQSIDHNQTTHSNEIIELFLQNNPQTT